MADIKWNIEAFRKEVEEIALDGIEEYVRTRAEPVAKQKCPVDTGAMRDTHQVERGSKEVVIGVGGPSVPYTEKQYFDMTLHHHDGQEDHWIEKGIYETIDSLEGIVAARMSRIAK